MPEPLQNTGVILGYRKSDYAGGTLPYQVNVPDGNWEPWLPPGEWQLFPPLDTMGCVSFSALNVIETLMNRMLYNGEMDDATIQKCIDKGYLRKK